jgi:hypothetical protein
MNPHPLKKLSNSELKMSVIRGTYTDAHLSHFATGWPVLQHPAQNKCGLLRKQVDGKKIDRAVHNTRG